MIGSLIFALLCVGGIASAQPSSEAKVARPVVAAETPERAAVGPVTVSVDASSNAIPVGGTFKFAVEAKAADRVDYLQLRMRLLMPDSGRLVYQKTFVEQSLEDTAVVATFARTIRDIGLDPGSYPVEVSVRASAKGEVTETVVPTRLLVFDPEADPVRVSLIIRVAPQPMTDADGNFVVDPAQFTRARNEVAQLARYVLEDPTAQIALAASPMMLQEWRQVSGGYRFAGPEGEIAVAATDIAPRAYRATLELLNRAVETGRLEMLTQGYADPNPSELHAADLLGDVATQFRWGRRALTEALREPPSAGMAPAGGGLPQAGVASLAENGLGYVAVDASRATRKGKVVSPGAYRTGAAGLAVLATDREVMRSLVQSSAAEVRFVVFEHANRSDENALVPVVVTVGPGGAQAQHLIGLVRGLDAQSWVEFALPGQAVRQGKAKVKLRAHRPSAEAPEDYWQTVAGARSWARALAFGLGPSDDSATAAVRNSLVAQSAVWAGFRGDWAPAGRGLSYAASAQRSARQVLDQVDLRARPVTMAGATGRVPVTITNDDDREIRVVLVAEPGESMRLLSKPERVLLLQPGENYTEVPVALSGTLRSSLRLSLKAGGLELADTSVTLRASYLDRIAVVGGLVLVFGVLLIFIIRRVKAAEGDAPNAEGGADPEAGDER